MFNDLKTLRRFQKHDVLETLPRPFKILGTRMFFQGKRGEIWDTHTNFPSRQMKSPISWMKMKIFLINIKRRGIILRF